MLRSPLRKSEKFGFIPQDEANLCFQVCLGVVNGLSLPKISLASLLHFDYHHSLLPVTLSPQAFCVFNNIGFIRRSHCCHQSQCCVVATQYGTAGQRSQLLAVAAQECFRAPRAATSGCTIGSRRPSLPCKHLLVTNKQHIPIHGTGIQALRLRCTTHHAAAAADLSWQRLTPARKRFFCFTSTGL